MRYCWYGQMWPGHMVRGKISPWQLASVKDVPRSLPLKFGQNRVSNSWFIPDIDKCRQDKWFLEKCYSDSWGQIECGGVLSNSALHWWKILMSPRGTPWRRLWRLRGHQPGGRHWISQMTFLPLLPLPNILPHWDLPWGCRGESSLFTILSLLNVCVFVFDLKDFFFKDVCICTLVGKIPMVGRSHLIQIASSPPPKKWNIDILELYINGKIIFFQLDNLFSFYQHLCITFIIRFVTVLDIQPRFKLQPTWGSIWTQKKAKIVIFKGVNTF